MQNQVEVLADDMGNVVRLSKNNPEYGYITLGYKSTTIGKGGWLKPRNLSTLILGNTDILTEYAKQLGKTIPGKIVVVESFEPFNSSDPDRDLKYAGNTGIICCQDGQPIYRKTEYTLDQTREDVLLDHNNGDAIRAANETAFNLVKKSKVKNATTAEAFGLKEVEDEIVDEEVVDEVETEDEVLEEEAETFDL